MDRYVDADLIKKIDNVILCNNLIKVIFEGGCSLEFTDHGIFAKDENENIVLESTADDPWWHKPKEDEKWQSRGTQRRKRYLQL